MIYRSTIARQPALCFFSMYSFLPVCPDQLGFHCIAVLPPVFVSSFWGRVAPPGFLDLGPSLSVRPFDS